jgi:hypothetical protein
MPTQISYIRLVLGKTANLLTFYDSLGNSTLVKSFLALSSNFTESLSKSRILEDLSYFWCLAIGAKEFTTVGRS